MTTTTALTVRLATDRDAATLSRLAALDEDAPLTGSALVAEADGRAVAALSLADGRAVADPFLPTAGAVSLLRLRADLLARGRSPGRHGRRLRARLA